jgi:hypothetical protein
MQNIQYAYSAIILFVIFSIGAMEIEPPCPAIKDDIKSSLPVTGPQLIAIIQNYQRNKLYVHSNTQDNKSNSVSIPQKARQEVDCSMISPLIYDTHNKCYKADYMLSETQVLNPDRPCLRFSVQLTPLPSNAYKAEFFLYKGGAYHLNIVDRHETILYKPCLPRVTKIAITVHETLQYNCFFGKPIFEE